ncbi:MAG: hypothetical protein VYA34_00350 [Myxococcota bacterium]|nr:hypothetical protein [Myxococcota bacterium]
MPSLGTVMTGMGLSRPQQAALLTKIQENAGIENAASITAETELPADATSKLVFLVRDTFSKEFDQYNRQNQWLASPQNDWTSREGRPQYKLGPKASQMPPPPPMPGADSTKVEALFSDVRLKSDRPKLSPPPPLPPQAKPPVSKSPPKHKASSKKEKWHEGQSVLVRSALAKGLGIIKSISGTKVVVEFPDGSERETAAFGLKPGLTPKQAALNRTFTEVTQRLEKRAPVALRDCVQNMDSLAIDSDKLAQMTASLSGSAKQQFVSNLIFSLYAQVDWSGPVSIPVYTEERQGKGDIVNGLKVCKSLREKFSHADARDIPFIVDHRSFGKLEELPKGFGIEPVTLPFSSMTADNNRMPSTSRPFDSVILAPTMTSFRGYQETRSLDRAISEKFTVGFEEFCKHTVAGVSCMGIKPQEMGIPIDQNLRAFKSKLSTISDQAARRDFRSQFMDSFQFPGLVNAIRAPRDLSPEKLQATIAEGTEVRSLEDYNTDSRMFFGYTNRSGSKFIKIAAQLEAGTKTDLDIVHVGEPYITQDHPDLGLAGLLKELKTDGAGFGALGYSKVEVLEFDSHHQPKTPLVFDLADGPLHGPSIRILLPRRLSPGDMNVGWKCGEEFVGCTGNQSAAEVISSGKPFFYETLAFTQNQQFAHDIFDIGRLGTTGKLNAALCSDVTSGMTTTVPDGAIAEFAREIQRDGTFQRYQGLSDHVAASSNFTQAVNGRVIQQLITRNADDGGAELREIESSLLTSDFQPNKFDAFLTQFKAYLQR